MGTATGFTAEIPLTNRRKNDTLVALYARRRKMKHLHSIYTSGISKLADIHTSLFFFNQIHFDKTAGRLFSRKANTAEETVARFFYIFVKEAFL